MVIPTVLVCCYTAERFRFRVRGRVRVTVKVRVRVMVKVRVSFLLYRSRVTRGFQGNVVVTTWRLMSKINLRNRRVLNLIFIVSN